MTPRLLGTGGRLLLLSAGAEGGQRPQSHRRTGGVDRSIQVPGSMCRMVLQGKFNGNATFFAGVPKKNGEVWTLRTMLRLGFRVVDVVIWERAGVS